jgi:hypothetical protein
LVAMAMAAALTGQVGPCRIVHGRMDLWNGSPTARIWVARTHRVLGVGPSDGGLEALPEAVRRIWTGRDSEADWKTSIVGDFKVCPLNGARPGHMQSVRLVDARGLTARPRHAPQAAGGGGSASTRAARPSL